MREILKPYFETTLKNLNLGVAIKWENVEFKPVLSQPYIEPIYIEYVPRATNIGPDVIRQLEGEIQINVYYPLGKGTRDSDLMVKRLLDAFPVGMEAYPSGKRVLVSNNSMFSLGDVEGWYQMVVRIQFWAFKQG